MNLVVAGRLARWHFAPTEHARQHLLREGLDPATIHVTGNTVIDALLSVADRRPEIGVPLDPAKRLILVTAHRRENFGAPFREICGAILRLTGANPDVQVLYPVHPNPNVCDVAGELLAGHPGITLCPPLDYLPFVGAMQRPYLILSDSGGVQEEAPALAKPVLVLRHETERPEVVDAGVVKLVGPQRERILAEAQRLLDDPDHYHAMARGVLALWRWASGGAHRLGASRKDGEGVRADSPTLHPTQITPASVISVEFQGLLGAIELGDVPRRAMGDQGCPIARPRQALGITQLSDGASQRVLGAVISLKTARISPAGNRVT